ncbi:MAG: TorF family putative porin [Gammaproteobacteria bacterium]|nr:TorF family putative porin [Gammaproteobacteria bacterium]
MKLKLSTLACSLLVLSQQSQAELSSTVTLLSDYTFNGISQTENNPALQLNLDYALANGFYLSSFASNVDFGDGDDTILEWDFSAGKVLQLTDNLSLDAGISYFTYHGDGASDEYAYPEMYAKFNYNSTFGDTELNNSYTSNYFGSGANHYVLMLAHTFELSEGHHLRLSADRSTSLDEDKWMWDADQSYNHYRVEYSTSWSGFDFNVAAEDTSLKRNTADARLLFSVARSFDL